MMKLFATKYEGVSVNYEVFGKHLEGLAEGIRLSRKLPKLEHCFINKGYKANFKLSEKTGKEVASEIKNTFGYHLLESAVATLDYEIDISVMQGSVKLEFVEVS